jgi:CheY-like chemotaxis protein
MHNAHMQVLLDCMMPVMDGFEVLRRLRAMSQSKHLPVIMVSARVSGYTQYAHGVSKSE